MKKDWDIVKNFAFCEGLDNVGTNFPEVPEKEFDESPLKEILDEIFCVDPVSGFPRGDIQYFLSKDGNPQVKAWLESNLLMPRMTAGSSLQGLTDDMIAEFSQRKDESLDDYTSRLQSLYDSARSEYEKSLQPPSVEHE